MIITRRALDWTAAVRILVSAGETSGDLYASELVRALQDLLPGTEFFGCAGVRLRAAGVRAVAASESLAVAGLVEVVRHLPRIKGEFDRLVAAAERERPDLAILTDSPDFHLRLARQLKARGIPVVYLIAPQVWAWRPGRVKAMRRDLDLLLCIFPFEEPWFRERGVNAAYIGHPLPRLVHASGSKREFCAEFGLDPERPLLALAPGSREGEIQRHLPVVFEAVERVRAAHPEVQPVLALAEGSAGRPEANFKERFRAAAIQVIEARTWDVLAHCDVALAASGTVTVEAALLGAPMVTFYRVNALSWKLGRRFVKAPHLTMVNLIAGSRVVPELMQEECTGARLAEETIRLLGDAQARDAMRNQFRSVREQLATAEDPIRTAAQLVAGRLRVPAGTG